MVDGTVDDIPSIINYASTSTLEEMLRRTRPPSIRAITSAINCRKHRNVGSRLVAFRIYHCGSVNHKNISFEWKNGIKKKFTLSWNWREIRITLLNNINKVLWPLFSKNDCEIQGLGFCRLGLSHLNESSHSAIYTEATCSRISFLVRRQKDCILHRFEICGVYNLSTALWVVRP